jgi:hypothetical protein
MGWSWSGAAGGAGSGAATGAMIGGVGAIPGAVIGGVLGGLGGGKQDKTDQFDPKDINARRSWLVNNGYYKDLEANMGEWDLSRAGLLGQNRDLYNMALSQGPVSANTGDLRRVAGNLSNLNWAGYDPARQAIGTAQDYRQQAATGGLPQQMMQTLQNKELMARLRATPGMNPAQMAQIGSGLTQQNNLSAANTRGKEYAGATQALMGAQGDLSKLYTQGSTAGMQGYGQAAGLELNADQINQQKFMMLSSILGQQGAMALMQNPYLMQKLQTDAGFATRTGQAVPGQNWGATALDALATGADAYSKWKDSRSSRPGINGVPFENPNG